MQGGLRGVNGIAGASLSLDVETKLDALDGLFQARLGLFHWQDRAVVSDASRDSEIELQLANYGLGAHLIARREWQDRSSWVGIGGVLVPFTLRTRFEGEDSIIGWGLHRPGVILTGGAARRALSGGCLESSDSLVSTGEPVTLATMDRLVEWRLWQATG